MMKRFFRGLWIKVPKRLRLFLVRSFEARFVVSVGGVIQNENGQVLILHHVFRVGSGWGIPGGFISKGEQPEEALKREMEEEIGLQIENLRLAFVHTLRSYNHIEIIYRAKAVGEAEIRSIEISQIKWFAIEDLPAE